MKKKKKKITNTKTLLKKYKKQTNKTKFFSYIKQTHTQRNTAQLKQEKNNFFLIYTHKNGGRSSERV